MKFIIPIHVMVILAISRIANAADFYIYAHYDSETPCDPFCTTRDLFGFYTAPPSCDDVNNAILYPPSEDLSQSEGVRCNGCSSGAGGEDDADITELEWNLDDWGHNTYYKDRGGIFVDMDGNTKGSCVQDTSDGYQCSYLQLTAYGRSQLRCTYKDDSPPPDPTPTPDPEPTPFFAMIVGDSITSGAEGDYTWRYRLYQWLVDQNVAPLFVGPWIGTHPPPEPTEPTPPRLIDSGPDPADPPRTDGKYAAGVEFTSAHFALWGRQAAQVKGEIKDQVTTYQPNYLLIMLGFNDIGWFVSDAEGTIASMKTLIDEARAAKPDIKFAIANIVQRTFIEGRDDLPIQTELYNRYLETVLPGWSTTKSPISLVRVQENYGCGPERGCPAGYDGLHPNALGEYQIAQAFSKTLVEDFGVGKTPLSIPAGSIPDKVPKVPTGLKVETPAYGLRISCDKIFGAVGYEFRSRLEGVDWPTDVATWPTWQVTNSWVLDGQKWEYQVRSSMGTDSKSDWSGTVSATAHPTTPKGPRNIYTEPRGEGIWITWDERAGTKLYEVITYDVETEGAFSVSRGVQGTSALVEDNLVYGHKHVVSVVSWTDDGPGFPAVARSVRVGGGVPAIPTGLKVENVDPTTVQLNWDEVPLAAGYQVWVRDWKLGEDFHTDDSSLTDKPSFGFAFLFPGTWNFEFCVSSYNGNWTSDRSDCVIPPVYPGYED